MQFSTSLSKCVQYPASLAYKRGIFFPGTGISATARLALLLEFACNGKSLLACGWACASCLLQPTCKSMFVNNAVLERKQTQQDSQATASYSDHKVIWLVCFVPPPTHPPPKILVQHRRRATWQMDNWWRGGRMDGHPAWPWRLSAGLFPIPPSLLFSFFFFLLITSKVPEKQLILDNRIIIKTINDCPSRLIWNSLRLRGISYKSDSSC